MGHGGFRRVLGTKIHVAAEQDGLPVPIVCGSADRHGSARLIGVTEDIPEPAGGDAMVREVTAVCADRGCDAACIGGCLECGGTGSCIPYRKDSGFAAPEGQNSGICSRTGFAVERFFGWLENGFHRTRIRHERSCDNCLGFVHLASIMVYWRVLG